MADCWQKLDAELDQWLKNDQTATMWWRDDDAARLTPAVKQLVEIAENAEIPLHLAVVPAALEAELTDYLNSQDHTRVLQHGYAHKNYAQKGEGKWELGLHRPVDMLLAELQDGLKILKQAFGSKFLAVQVPPWTRIDTNIVNLLPELGFVGLSMENPRDNIYACSGLRIVNTHCDPIKWKNGPYFKGDDRAVEYLIDHLQLRRTAKTDATEPTGICTHHLDHDKQLWKFLERLAAQTNRHAAVKWISLGTELDHND